jgi:hypothetical protein
MVRITRYSDGFVEMGDDPEVCERNCGSAYDRALFTECPKCKALRRAAEVERDRRLTAAIIAATDGEPQH